MLKPTTMSTLGQLIWDSMEINVEANGKPFTIKQKSLGFSSVKGFACFVNGKKKTGYRLMNKEQIDEWSKGLEHA